jgi:hypothetical protein
VVSPFLLEPQVLNKSLGAGLAADMLGDEESWGCEIDPGETFSSANLEDPVIGMET